MIDARRVTGVGENVGFSTEAEGARQALAAADIIPPSGWGLGSRHDLLQPAPSPLPPSGVMLEAAVIRQQVRRLLDGAPLLDNGVGLPVAAKEFAETLGELNTQTVSGVATAAERIASEQAAQQILAEAAMTAEPEADTSHTTFPAGQIVICVGELSIRQLASA